VDITLSREDRSLIGACLRDGHALLSTAALGLLAAGLFAWFLALSDQLLPHDLAWLTIDEAQLRSIADGRLVHFMAHDRAAFGGTLVAVAILDLWLVAVPLRAGRPWAWWALAFGGAVGFVSFLTYLGTGYLDLWHGLATLALLPSMRWASPGPRHARSSRPTSAQPSVRTSTSNPTHARGSDEDCSFSAPSASRSRA
jgi:hypothetical protein